jgi:hypothetical protein
VRSRVAATAFGRRSLPPTDGTPPRDMKRWFDTEREKAREAMPRDPTEMRPPMNLRSTRLIDNTDVLLSLRSDHDAEDR